MKIMKFKIPIYFGWFQVVVTDNFKEAEKRLRITGDTPDELYDAYTVRTNSAYTLVIKPNLKPSAIAHEGLHVVNMLFEDRGVKLSTDNDEPSAYMLSWVVDKIHIALNNHKRTKIT